SGEAAGPPRRSGGTLRLDTARKPWHKKDDWLGPSKHRGGHRGSGDLTSRPSPRPQWSSAYREMPGPKRPWTLTHLRTHGTRPQVLGNLAAEREIPTAPTATFPFSIERRNRRPKPCYDDRRPDL